MRSHILFNNFTGLYDATLLGGEFSNCQGQGKTPEEATMSLKLTVRALRKQALNKEKKIAKPNFN